MSDATMGLVSSQIALSNKKSMGIALLLTLLFGPLGMFYSTILGAILCLVIGVPALVATFGLAVFLVWPIQLIWTALAVKSFNRRKDEQALGAVQGAALAVA